MAIYVDDGGNIVGRDINFASDESEIVMKYAFTKKGKDVGILYSYDYDGSSIEFSGKGKLSGTNLSGEFSLVQGNDDDETTLFVVDVEKLNLAKLGDENQEMALTIKAEDGIDDVYYGMSMLSGYALRLEENKSKSVIAILEDMETYDIEDDGVTEWVETFDTDKFIDQLGETDLPQEWIDAIEASLGFLSN